MNVLSLFSGIGGMDLGLEWAGFTTVGQVEIDPFARAVLSRHWPEVPRHDDVRTAIDWWLRLSQRRPHVDVVAGGYPCQPESLAGKRRGHDDERWLWPDMARVVATLRPRFVIGENVMGHRTRGLRFVLRDLDRLGYTARAGVVSAEEMGAPHRRQRIFVIAERPDVADAGSAGLDPGRGERGVEDGQPAGVTRQAGSEPVGPSWRATEPDVGRVAYGVPARVDRLRTLGNACVPQVAQHIGSIILDGTWKD